MLHSTNKSKGTGFKFRSFSRRNEFDPRLEVPNRKFSLKLLPRLSGKLPPRFMKLIEVLIVGWRLVVFWSAAKREIGTKAGQLSQKGSKAKPVPRKEPTLPIGGDGSTNLEKP